MSLYIIVKTKYRLHKITAADVWAYVTRGELTHDQALSICGAKPVD